MKKGRVIVVYDQSSAQNFDGKLTVQVVIICIAIASAGFIFGYDNASFGALLNVKPFTKEFFPSVFDRLYGVGEDKFCIFDSVKMKVYVSSLYVAGVFSALMAGHLTTSAGRKGCLIIGGIIYLIGTFLRAGTVTYEMLVLGRILAGFGLGFTNQVAPIYLAEMAPTRWRGSFCLGFFVFSAIGGSAAHCMSVYLKRFGGNYWRAIIGLGAIPATTVVIMAFFIPDTPNSLIQRGKVQEALKTLNQVRSSDVDAENELKFLIKYHEAIRNVSENPYRLLFKRQYRPHIVFAIAIPSCQQLGISMLMSGPLRTIVYRSLQLNDHQIFLYTLLQSTTFTLSTLAAAYLIDRVGRKPLFIEGGIQALICQLVLGKLLASPIGTNGATELSKGSAIVGLFTMLAVGVAFATSWGPLAWILPTEILPTEVREAGYGLSVAFNLAFHFITSQTSISLFCHFKYGFFFFQGACVTILTILIVLFLPETKRIPLESMDIIWFKHWYWHRFTDGTIFNA